MLFRSPTDAARAIEAFVDDLSNWYVRRSRRRFWRGVSESDSDKQSAYFTLYSALTTLSLLLAPFTPFVAEELWQNLVRSIDKDAPESVHLAYWPVADMSRIDESLNAETQLVKRICSLGRAARAKAQIKVRQPLAEVWVKTRGLDAREERSLERSKQLILDELNAKEYKRLLGETGVVSYTAKPNLPVLGPKYGSAIGAIRQALATLSPELLEIARRHKPITVAGVVLERDDILFEIGRAHV